MCRKTKQLSQLDSQRILQQQRLTCFWYVICADARAHRSPSVFLVVCCMCWCCLALLRRRMRLSCCRRWVVAVTIMVREVALCTFAAHLRDTLTRLSCITRVRECMFVVGARHYWQWRCVVRAPSQPRRTLLFFLLALRGTRLQREPRPTLCTCLGAHHSGSVSACASSTEPPVASALRCWPASSARRDFACACARSLTAWLDASAIATLARAFWAACDVRRVTGAHASVYQARVAFSVAARADLVSLLRACRA